MILGLVEIGSLFASQIEGYNFQKIISKNRDWKVWLEMGVKDALFIYLSEYITFMTRAGVEQSQKCEKLRKKKPN